MWKQLIAAGLVLLIAACTLPRNVVVVLPEDDSSAGKIVVTHDHTDKELAAPYAALGTGTGAGGDVFTADRGAVESAFSSALAATPREPAIYIIYFVVNDDVAEPRSTATLADAVKAARTTSDADISVVGHADATGDEDANRVLSLRRAQVVRAALVNAGVAAPSIQIDYHGSSNPRVSQPRGVPEPLNRRVEVTIR